MHSWRGRWYEYYRLRKDDPFYWLNETKELLEKEDAEWLNKVEEEDPVTRPVQGRKLPSPNLPKPQQSQPPKERKYSSNFSSEDDRLLRKFHRILQGATEKLDAWEDFVQQVNLKGLTGVYVLT